MTRKQPWLVSGQPQKTFQKEKDLYQAVLQELHSRSFWKSWGPAGEYAVSHPLHMMNGLILSAVRIALAIEWSSCIQNGSSHVPPLEELENQSLKPFSVFCGSAEELQWRNAMNFRDSDQKSR